MEATDIVRQVGTQAVRGSNHDRAREIKIAFETIIALAESNVTPIDPSSLTDPSRRWGPLNPLNRV